MSTIGASHRQRWARRRMSDRTRRARVAGSAILAHSSILVSQSKDQSKGEIAVVQQRQQHKQRERRVWQERELRRTGRRARGWSGKFGGSRRIRYIEKTPDFSSEHSPASAQAARARPEARGPEPCGSAETSRECLPDGVSIPDQPIQHPLCGIRPVAPSNDLHVNHVSDIYGREGGLSIGKRTECAFFSGAAPLTLPSLLGEV